MVIINSDSFSLANHRLSPNLPNIPLAKLSRYIYMAVFIHAYLHNNYINTV